jgi:hypothetical protein
MKKYIILPIAMLLAAGSVGCKRRPNEIQPSSFDAEQFKAAIIAYVDAHPGYFIGRKDSTTLKSEAIVLWGKDDNGLPVYSLVEFLIYPSKMSFNANYGMESIEPYLYEGRFTRTKDGGIAVGDIDLTRLHVDPQQPISSD